MKIIKVFLASSTVEFKHERMELGNFVRLLNECYAERGIYFKLQLCEDMSKAISDKRKQEEYNQEIRESRFFYALFGREAGEYTIEEFDVALEQCKASGAPRIFVYFRKLPEGEPAAGITAFRERLDRELGCFYSFFDTLDFVKLNLLIELAHTSEVNGLLKVEEGKAMLDGKEMLSLENVPLFGKNESFQKLRAERDRLNEEFSRMAAEYARNPDGALLAQLSAAGGRREEATKQLRQMETDMLNLYTTIAERNSSGKAITWQEKKALLLLDEGKYEEALAALRHSSRITC